MSYSLKKDVADETKQDWKAKFRAKTPTLIPSTLNWERNGDRLVLKQPGDTRPAETVFSAAEIVGWINVGEGKDASLKLQIVWETAAGDPKGSAGKAPDGWQVPDGKDEMWTFARDTFGPNGTLRDAMIRHAKGMVFDKPKKFHPQSQTGKTTLDTVADAIDADLTRMAGIPTCTPVRFKRVETDDGPKFRYSMNVSLAEKSPDGTPPRKAGEVPEDVERYFSESSTYRAFFAANPGMVPKRSPFTVAHGSEPWMKVLAGITHTSASGQDYLKAVVAATVGGYTCSFYDKRKRWTLNSYLNGRGLQVISTHASKNASSFEDEEDNSDVYGPSSPAKRARLDDGAEAAV